MNGEWLAYMKQLHEYLRQQNETLRDMDRQLRELRQEWTEFRQQAGQPVKHEYRFDLLKVEQLQGNLHIGVKPEDNGNWIDQLAVDGNMSDGNGQNREMEDAYGAIRRQIDEYFANEAEQTLKEIEQKWAVSLDDAHRQLVLIDVEKQINSRIRHYLQQKKEEAQEGEMAWQEIVDRVKQDVAATFDTFIRNYGGGEQE